MDEKLEHGRIPGSIGESVANAIFGAWNALWAISRVNVRHVRCRGIQVAAFLGALGALVVKMAETRRQHAG